VLLAYILVPSSSGSVTSGNIKSETTFTGAQGGILPVADAAVSVPAGYAGAMIYDATTGSFRHNPASGQVQAHVLPFGPATNCVAAERNFPGTPINRNSVTVTTDGNTDLRIYCGLQDTGGVGVTGGRRTWARTWTPRGRGLRRRVASSKSPVPSPCRTVGHDCQHLDHGHVPLRHWYQRMV
jgi:hypothetical protein